MACFETCWQVTVNPTYKTLESKWVKHLWLDRLIKTISSFDQQDVDCSPHPPNMVKEGHSWMPGFIQPNSCHYLPYVTSVAKAPSQVFWDFTNISTKHLPAIKHIKLSLDLHCKYLERGTWSDSWRWWMTTLLRQGPCPILLKKLFRG